MLSRSLAFGALVGLATYAVAEHAHAAEDKTVTGTISLGGAVTYRTLTIMSGGSITVLPYVAGSTTSTGMLSITADKIIVQMGGSIVADGAGFPGADGMPGGCSMLAGGMCAKAGTAMGLPGGGGGFFAAGANGTSEMTAGTCVDLGATAAGGRAFFDMTTMTLDLGSAGGAANSSSLATAGYAGGGYVQLAATVITIDGTVSANGTSSPAMPHVGGVGPGGGSGGAIEITTVDISGAGTISAKGGDGAHGAGVPGTPAIPANNGGGGSGGVVLIHLAPAKPQPVMTDVTGGKTGDCTTLGGPAGTVLVVPGEACLDLDHDTYKSILCGGTDCDDTDPTIHPGQPEKCNGIDDNCSGMIDEGPNVCPAGQACVAPDGGTPMCVDVDAGMSGGLDQYIEFKGGCEVPSAGSEESLATRALGALGLGLALAAVRMRRRRSQA